ncbi:MAG: TonB-dependent receptor [Bacteroidales bacterium]|nr:TonB-dependent receptor [Bacteroidales bacterium]MCF8403409.1 TonB-dependent receptor [Bacteroidales bacterium]
MRRIIFGIICMIFGITLQSQEIFVFDNSNLQPIENLAIVNLQRTKSVITDTRGKAKMDAFTSDETLFFQHPSFQELVLTYSQIKDLKFKIGLNASTVNLSEIVISASKWEQKREEVPNKITTIKAKEIAFYNSQTSADLLGVSNEVFIQKSQLGGGSPMIRGFSANSVLIVVDGVRMNNAIYRSGNLQNVISLDPNIIQSAEVIFGPGSIIYGSDALGGVMDFHTKDVVFNTNKKTRVAGNAFSRYSTANNEKTIHADFNIAGRKFGSVSSITYSDFGDLRMGSVGNDEYQRFEYVDRIGNVDSVINNSDPNIQKFSGYNQLNLTQKLSLKISGNNQLDYAFHLSTTSDIPRYDRLIQYKKGNLRYGDWHYGPQKWMMHSLTYNINTDNDAFDHAKLTLAFQDVEESRVNRSFGDDFLSSRTDEVKVYSLNMDMDKKLSNKSTLFYGFEGFFNKVTSTAFTESILTGERLAESTRYPDGGSNYTTAAMYINFKSNIHKKITLQTGLRFSQVFAESKFIDTTFYNFDYDKIELNTGALNGSLGLVYRPSEKSTVNLNLSSGFRAPNIDDLAKVFDSEPGSVVVPNNTLKPEYAYNIDLGITDKINQKFRIEATGFYTLITNLMARADYTVNGMDSIYYDGELSKVQAIQNVNSGWIAGISFGIKADLSEHLGFSTTLTYSKGKDSNNDPIRHVAPVFGSGGVSYSARKIKVEAYVNFNGNITNKNLSSSEQGKPYLYATDDDGLPYSPSWYTLNIKSFYQITSYLQINFGIENILDHRYRPYSSGIVAPGRNIILAVRANF